MTAAREGDRFTMAVDVELRIKFLGVTAYLYQLDYREVWEGGRLISLEGKTLDDGDEDFVRLTRVGDGFRIDGTGYTGPANGDATPTSYWNYDAAFDGGRWISTQSGKLFDMNFRTSSWNQGGEQVDASGDFETRLFYDADREWRGCVFDAGGVDCEYVQTDPGPAFRTLLQG